MSGLQVEFLKSVISNLKSNAELSAIIGNRVYEKVPLKLPYPFLVVGEMIVGRSNDDFYDTIDISVVAYSNNESFAEIANITDMVKISLDENALGVDGYEQFPNGTQFKQIHHPPYNEDFRIGVVSFSYAFVNDNAI